MNENVDIIDIDNDDIVFEDDEIIFDNDINDKSNNIKNDHLEDKINNIKNDHLEDITDIMKREELNRNQLLEEAFDSINNHSSSIIELEKKAKNFNLLKNKFMVLQKEYINLNSTCMIKSEKINYINNELKEAKRTINNYEKKISMLKSLLEIIIKVYGYDEVCRITRLTKSQIERFLN